VYEENAEANARSHHILTRTLKQCLIDMTTRKVELFYYPVFKGSKEPTKEELQLKIVNYFILGLPYLIRRNS